MLTDDCYIYDRAHRKPTELTTTRAHRKHTELTTTQAHKKHTELTTTRALTTTKPATKPTRVTFPYRWVKRTGVDCMGVHGMNSNLYIGKSQTFIDLSCVHEHRACCLLVMAGSKIVDGSPQSLDKWPAYKCKVFQSGWSSAGCFLLQPL